MHTRLLYITHLTTKKKNNDRAQHVSLLMCAVVVAIPCSLLPLFLSPFL